VKIRSAHLKATGIIQAVGATLGIASAIVYTGGHPSLAVLIGLAVIPANLLLALMQVVAVLFSFTGYSAGEISPHGTYWWYLLMGWTSTAAFVSWQWPPLFI
jgi:hypothetical protein